MFCVYDLAFVCAQLYNSTCTCHTVGRVYLVYLFASSRVENDGETELGLSRLESGDK